MDQRGVTLQVLPEYQLRLRFHNGSEALVDMKRRVRAIRFGRLSTPGLFGTARLVGSEVWRAGAQPVGSHSVHHPQHGPQQSGKPGGLPERRRIRQLRRDPPAQRDCYPYGSVTVRATFTASDSVSQCLHSTSCPAYRFTDLDLNAWYHDGIHYCVEQGQMNGVSGDTFQPEGTTTRGMIVTILYRMEGEPTVTGTSKFNDVPADQWYTDAVVWAADNDIVTGYGGGRFGPDDPITREQMAVILFRYAQYKGHDVSIGEDTNILSYVDATEIGEYAIPAMQWACGSALINGVSGNALNPKGTASRAEAATLLMRFAQKIIK